MANGDQFLLKPLSSAATAALQRHHACGRDRGHPRQGGDRLRRDGPLQFEEARGGGPRLGDRALVQQPPVLHERDSVGDPRGLVPVVRDEQDAHALGAVRRR